MLTFLLFSFDCSLLALLGSLKHKQQQQKKYTNGQQKELRHLRLVFISDGVGVVVGDVRALMTCENRKSES